MISVEGQYAFKFSIDDLQDFLNQDDLKNFTIIESAGNILPTFEFTFISSKQNLPRYINEGAGLKVWYGASKNDMTETDLIITSYTIRVSGSGFRIYNLKGLATKKEYINNPANRVLSNVSGIEAINTIVSSYFKFESNTDASSDSQSWIQYNNSDKHFVNQIWLHTYLPNSFPVVGITADGKFILKDVKKLLGTSPVWRFTNTIKDKSKDIVYDEYLMKSDSGFINSWVGYGNKTPVLDMETDTESVDIPTIEPMIAHANYISRKSTLNNKYNEFALLNDNVHENYVEAYNHNLAYLAVFSSHRVKLKYSNKFKDTKLLDLIQFEDYEINSTNRLSEYQSGLYLVSKVSRTLGQNSFVTELELCKENYNSLKGSFR